MTLRQGPHTGVPQTATKPAAARPGDGCPAQPLLGVGGLLTKGRQATLSSPSHGGVRASGAPTPKPPPPERADDESSAIRFPVLDPLLPLRAVVENLLGQECV